jgi:hypothetical protein
MSRVTVITAGHASTCPRMLKAADALHGAGYHVHLVSANFSPWAATADRSVFASRPWTSVVVDYSRQSAAVTAIATSLRWRLATAFARRGAQQSAWWAVTRSYSRAHDELVAAAAATGADFYYGGTTGGLAVTCEVAERTGKPYALDLEDWHVAESIADDAATQHACADRIHRRVLPGARFVTTSTRGIAAAAAERYGIEPVTIHNVFPLPPAAPSFDAHGERLRVCWFGQTIGAGRGLEAIVDIAARAGVAIDLDLRGRVAGDFGAVLTARAAASHVRLSLLPPLPPDALVDWCRSYHVGLGVEPQDVRNKELCLSNKICTYLLAGVAVVANDSPGQRVLASDAGEGIAWHRSGDVDAAAQALRRWFACRDALRRSREASWRAAAGRWHWEHGEERGALVAQVARVAG